MSESNRTLENSSLELSEKPRDEKADLHISNKINSLSNPLDLNNPTDMTGSRTNVYSYNRDSRGENNGGRDFRNQMIDLPKLLRQLSLARVVLKRLPISTEATKLRITDDLTPINVGIVDRGIDVNVPQDEHVPPSEYIDDDKESNADAVAIGDTCDIVDDAEPKFADKLTATWNRTKPANMIKRSCPKCKALVADASVSKKQSCAKCKTPLSYQCARCDKRYISYSGLLDHFNAICNPQNLDLKCAKCDYQTYSEYSMKKHKVYCSNRTIYICSHCEFKTRGISNFNVHMRIKHEAAEKSTTTFNKQKSVNLMKRYCPKCKLLIAVVHVSKKQSCDKCDSPVSFQCARCDKQYAHPQSLLAHLDAICNAQNLDLKCPMCDYRTHAKSSMTKHLSNCLSGNSFSCGLCGLTTKIRYNLLSHMTTTHKDILKVDCSPCKTKSNKCEQCKSKMPICETCHTGFSSTDSFQEHQKTCKPPVLECKYCSYQTIDNRMLRKHIKLEHLSGSIPRALPVKD